MDLYTCLEVLNRLHVRNIQAELQPHWFDNDLGEYIALAGYISAKINLRAEVAIRVGTKPVLIIIMVETIDRNVGYTI